MEANLPKWQNQAITPLAIQAIIDHLNTQESRVVTLKEQLNKIQAEAHALVKECKDYVDRVEAIAIGRKGYSAEKLVPSGIKLRKEATKRNRPSALLDASLLNDIDRIGFMLTTQIDPDAEHMNGRKEPGLTQQKSM